MNTVLDVFIILLLQQVRDRVMCPAQGFYILHSIISSALLAVGYTCHFVLLFYISCSNSKSQHQHQQAPAVPVPPVRISVLDSNLTERQSLETNSNTNRRIRFIKMKYNFILLFIGSNSCILNQLVLHFTYDSYI